MSIADFEQLLQQGLKLVHSKSPESVSQLRKLHDDHVAKSINDRVSEYSLTRYPVILLHSNASVCRPSVFQLQLGRKRVSVLRQVATSR